MVSSEIIQPDAMLWYTLCGVLGLALLGLLGWIALRTEKLLQEIVKSIANHETRITVLETNGVGKSKR